MFGGGELPMNDRYGVERIDAGCKQQLTMFYGVHSMHSFLERSVWHSAQHTRQLLSWCDEKGIPVEHQLTEDVLRGLPMPEGLWE